MAVENMNDSYNRCIAELRSRYRGKALSNNAKHEAAALKERDALSAAEKNDGYLLFDSRSKIADSYRSGVYNGSRYMTSDDFVRYFRSRRAFYCLLHATPRTTPLPTPPPPPSPPNPLCPPNPLLAKAMR